jgi:sRNA-binding regulator protein Hfq
MVFSGKWLVISALLFLTIAAVLLFYFNTWKRGFEAPRKTASPVTFMVTNGFTLQGIINNLFDYGFVKNKEAFVYALEHTKDTTPGKENSVKIGTNTIDLEANYEISQSMTAWELANALLNKGTPNNNCSGGCHPGMFYPELLPGGNPAPSATEIYQWVKTYEDCVKAKGQLSSEQYAQKTGIRKCVTPDGREFTQGKEGWTKAVGG